nr:microtubule-associated protein 70-2-like [Ipomoea batatas]
MAEVPGERSVTATEVSSGENGCNVRPATAEATPLQLTVSASFKEGKTAMMRALVRSSLDADEFINLLHGSDRVKVKLNRLENKVRDKDRESSEAQAEIKALRFSERLPEKTAVEENDLVINEISEDDANDVNDQIRYAEVEEREWTRDSIQASTSVISDVF